MPKLKKEDYIRALTLELTPAAWDAISKTQHKPQPSTFAKKQDLLNKVFHKSAKPKHSVSRDACQELQKDACQLYSAVTGLPWASSRDDHADIKPRQSGQAGIDVVLSSRAIELLSKIGFPSACECKNTKNWDLQQAIIQARANTQDGQDWLLVMKRRAPLKTERIDPVVVMDLQVFQGLILACLREKGL